MFRFLFWVFLLSFCCLLMVHPSFSIIDDHLFLSTTLAGKWLPWLIHPTQGRFFPLTAQEYNLISLFSKEAWSYYLFNLSELLLFFFLLLPFLKRLGVSSPWRYALCCFLFLTPEFVASFFRFFVGERHLLLWGLCLIIAYDHWLKTPKFLYGFIVIMLSNLILYQKETGLFFVGGMAYFPLFLQLTKGKWKRIDLILPFLMTLSLVTYLITFYLVSYQHTVHLYGQSDQSRIVSMIKNFINYFQNSPMIIIGLPILFIKRFWDIFIQKVPVNILVDSLLLTAMMSLCGFFLVNLYSDRYLLPTYLFLLIPLSLYARKYRMHYLLLFLLVLHPFGYTLHTLSYFNYFPYHFQTSMTKIATLIKMSPKENLKVALLGIDPDPGQQGELFESVSRYLQFYGIESSRFQLISENEGIGDFALVFGPHITKYNFDQEHQEKALENYRLLWQSQSPLAIPDLSYKNLMKYGLQSDACPKFIKDRFLTNSLMQSSNILKWPDVWLLTHNVIEPQDVQ